MHEKVEITRGRPLRGLYVSPLSHYPVSMGSQASSLNMVEKIRGAGHELWHLGINLKEEEIRGMERALGDRFRNAVRPRLREHQSTLQAAHFLIRQAIHLRLGWDRHVDEYFHNYYMVVAREMQARHNFDFVIVDYIFWTRIFEAFPSGVLKIVNTHDTFGERNLRIRKQDPQASLWYSCSIRDERTALLRSDCIIGIQPEESAYLSRLTGGRRRVITSGPSSQWNPQPEPNVPVVGLLASGSPLNLNGLRWFLLNCWPAIIKSVPAARMLVAGSICDSLEVESAVEGVEVMGRVVSVEEFHHRTMVEINPVFAGTGLKLKTMATLSHGRPLVTTPEGAAGLDPSTSAYSVASSAETFTDAVVRLLQDSGARRRMVTAAGEMVAKWNQENTESIRLVLAEHAEKRLRTGGK